MGFSLWGTLIAGINLTDRIYFAVHLALTLLVLARYDRVPHWPLYVVWNISAMLAIVLLAHKQRDGAPWEFAHDWLPAVVFFTAVFEEASFLSLALIPGWQNSHIANFEAALFGISPAVWLRQHIPSWSLEFLEFGYFSFYLMYPIVGLILWARRKHPGYSLAFRRMTDALAVGFLICYATYILWPTQSPLHAMGLSGYSGHGPFHWMVGVIQGSARVHGNAFPSGHIMLAFAILVFVWRYLPRAAPWLLLLDLLMCLGAVYDGYHYASDALAGALIGVSVAFIFVSSRKRLPRL